jgi:hypothetical protein
LLQCQSLHFLYIFWWGMNMMYKMQLIFFGLLKLFLPWNFNCLFTSSSDNYFVISGHILQGKVFFNWSANQLSVTHQLSGPTMLLALESQICVVIVLRKEFNRTMTCSRSTELSCLCVKPVGGTKGQYLNEILSKTDKTWTWCCIIVSSHICWINFEPGKVSFLENNNKCFINFIQKKKEFTYLQYTPSVSTIILSGRTYSSQNVRLTPEKCPTNLSQHSLSPTIWSDIVVGRESGYLKICFTFLEVNMSNILWSMRICKRTFSPVCRMSGYVNTLVYF